jgi:hypothetical protein
VQLTRDGGKTWANVTPKDLPPFARISLIEVSPHRAGTAYVAAKRYQMDDRAPYIYRTDNFGETWVKTVKGIGASDYVHAVREDPVRPFLLFAGTEHGVYISFDNGTSWQRFNRDLPDVQVSDLLIKDNDLAIGTHGRSMYVMDNIISLRQLTPQITKGPVVLFKPADAFRGLDQGVALSYYLKSAAKHLAIEVLDQQGTSIRKYVTTPDTARDNPEGESPEDESHGPPRPPRAPMRAGSNRFTWDMRTEPPVRFPGMILWAAGTNGPRVLPGDYQVRLTADSHAPVTQSFRIVKDPRAPHVTMADLQAQHELATRVRDKLNQANEAVMMIRGVKSQIDERVKQANDGKFGDVSAQLKDKLIKVEEEIYQVRLQSNQDPLNYPIKLNNKIAALLNAVEGSEGMPTAQSNEVFTELSARLDQQLAWLKDILDRDVTAYNARWVQPRGLSAVELKPIAAE